MAVKPWKDMEETYVHTAKGKDLLWKDYTLCNSNFWLWHSGTDNFGNSKKISGFQGSEKTGMNMQSTEGC
jgi:hypothetical protein